MGSNNIISDVVRVLFLSYKWKENEPPCKNKTHNSGTISWVWLYRVPKPNTEF